MVIAGSSEIWAAPYQTTRRRIPELRFLNTDGRKDPKPNKYIYMHIYIYVRACVRVCVCRVCCLRVTPTAVHRSSGLIH
jgi:hypothetical protein